MLWELQRRTPVTDRKIVLLKVAPMLCAPFEQIFEFSALEPVDEIRRPGTQLYVEVVFVRGLVVSADTAATRVAIIKVVLFIGMRSRLGLVTWQDMLPRRS
jgi:hypothetical protein